MTSAVTQGMLAAAEEAGHIELPFEPIWYGVLSMVLFLALLVVLWGFRNTLALDPHKSDHDSGGSSGH